MDAIKVILDFLRGKQLGTHAINSYQSSYRTICAFCEKRGLYRLSHSEAEEFADIHKNRYEKGDICKDYYQRLRKSAFLLADCMQGHGLVYGITHYPKKELGEYFAHVIKEWEAYLSPSIAKSTISGAVSYARQFLFFLEGSGQCDFTHLTDECFKLFLTNVAETHRNSMGTLIWSLRKFLSFLNATARSPINAERHLLRPAPNQAKALPCFTEQEKMSILSAIDTETQLGKRDYAIVKLAIETGLRGVDIFRLRLEDINWHTCEIALIQSKTGEPIHMPLLPDVGNAIADYILHARPESKTRNVFLNVKSPRCGLGTSGNGKHIINRYLEKAGINHRPWDGKTFHAFRRTYGTRLVEAGVPLQSVVQLLGQKHIDSAKRYISQSDTMLRTCCLGISGYETSKEGLK